MSWEAYGSGPDLLDVEQLYRRGWESDADCEKWWKTGEPDKVYTLDEAVKVYEDWLYSED